MKIKKIILLITAVLSILSLSLFVGCKKSGSSDSIESSKGDASSDGKISLSVVTADLIYGDKLDIICFYSGDKAVEWSSSDESVATVDGDGSVTTAGVGTCSVTAKAGEVSASCTISVSMGDYLPELKVMHLKNNELVLRVGDEFEPEIKVLFNKVYYDCEVNFSSSASGVVDYLDGKLKAIGEGEVTASFSGKWLDFAADKLHNEVKIVVKKAAVYNTEIVIDGEEVSSSLIELSLIPSWQGKNYPIQAEVSSSVCVDGTTYACEFSSNDKILNLEKVADGKIRVASSGIGNATLTAKYVHSDGAVYETEISVEIYCPTEVYSEQFDFCPSKPIDMAAIFGSQYATVLYASQNGKELVTEFNYVHGVKVAGEDTQPLTVLTTVGGFIFDNVFAYDAELTKDDILEELQLGNNGSLIKDGYYILNSDITETIDFTTQKNSVYSDNAPQNNSYFCGTFDGRGHTLKAKVGQNGVFGGLYKGAVIKNTEFIFEFSDKTESCGLAGNDGTFSQSSGTVELNNLHVKTVNYYKNSYALFGYCSFNLEMYDIFVELNGTENLPDYTDATSEMAALFHNDYTATMASGDGKFKGGFRNIFVVTGKFMPMACGYYPYEGGYRYVSYAKNDESYLGEFKAMGYSHLFTFCLVYSTDDDYSSYFGNISYTKVKDKEQPYSGKGFAWIFKAREDIKDGGIERYDSTLELSKKIDKIGTWDVV